MSGLFFLAITAVWLVAAGLLARWLIRWIKIKRGVARNVLAPSLYVVLLLLPVADEIVGGIQFRRLCRENAVLHIDAEKAKGRTVRVVVEPLNEIVLGTAIPIYHSRESFRDVTTNEEIASNDWYAAKGGWFIRILGIFEGHDPLIIETSTCYPRLGRREIANTYGFVLTK